MGATLPKILGSKRRKISIPDDRNFETEGEAIESGLRRTVESRNMMMRSLIRAVYRFRDAALVAEKKDDFGNALPKAVSRIGASGGSGRTGLIFALLASGPPLKEFLAHFAPDSAFSVNYLMALSWSGSRFWFDKSLLHGRFGSVKFFEGCFMPLRSLAV